MESEVWNTARCTQYTLLKAIYILPEKWMFLKDKTKHSCEQSQYSHYKSCHIKWIFYNKTTLKKKQTKTSLPESDFPK